MNYKSPVVSGESIQLVGQIEIQFIEDTVCGYVPH
jgi:hypothetical protein